MATYTFRNDATGETVRRAFDVNDARTAAALREFLRDGFRLVSIKLEDARPLVGLHK